MQVYAKHTKKERTVTEGQGTVLAAESRHFITLVDTKELAEKKRTWQKQTSDAKETKKDMLRMLITKCSTEIKFAAIGSIYQKVSFDVVSCIDTCFQNSMALNPIKSRTYVKCIFNF